MDTTRRITHRPHRTRVALVSWHTSPLAAPGAEHAGGMNVYVRELALALTRLGPWVDVITSAADMTRPSVRVLAPRLRLMTVPRRGGLDLRRLPLPRYDVVHSHYWQSAAAARALVERTGARHVHTFHTLGQVKNAALAPGDNPEPDHRLLAERAIVAQADAVVVATHTERAQVMEHLGGDPARVHVVAPGVDLARFRPRGLQTARARLGLGEGLLAVHVGRIQPLKGIDVAVRAFAELGAHGGRHCLLALAGGPSGPMGPHALGALRREASALPRGISMNLLGRWEHPRLPLLLNAADVAVVPSRTESFCLAALEAQACGVPIVGTAVGGLPDIVAEGESGYLVARDPSAFATRLGELLGCASLRRRMRVVAAESARRFTWTATASAIADVYAL